MPGRLLGLFAHPHEESLLCGGTFARYAGAGAATLIAAATPANDFDEIVATFQPDVVVTFSPDGGYGDADHLLVHAAATAAFFSARQNPGRSASRPARLYYACRPQRRQRRALDALRARGLPSGLLGSPQDAATPDEAVTTVLDVRAQLATKIAAVAGVDGLPAQDLEELCGWEFYVRVFPPPWVAGVSERGLLNGPPGPALDSTIDRFLPKPVELNSQSLR